QVPGAEEADMVYDQRDRRVFSQDGDQREARQWVVYDYDGLNRIVENGLYTDIDATRPSLQSQMNALRETRGPMPAADNLTASDRSANAASVYVGRNSITFTSGFTSGTRDAFTTLIDPSATVDNTNAGNGTNPLPPIEASAVVPLTY